MPEDAEPKRAKQAELLSSSRFEYLGNGPDATGPEPGWRMNPNLFLKCTQCGYLLKADPTTSDVCFCHALHKDRDAGRVGSTLGDAAIEVYRRVPLSPPPPD